MPAIWEYDFMQRALLAGLIVGVICPAIGVFIVVRRQALIGDGLGHVAFAGVTAGWVLGIYPLYSAVIATVLAAFGIESLRRRNPSYADTALAIFFYSGIALAALFSSMSKASTANLLGYLFGSIVTVSLADLTLIGGLGSLALLAVGLFYKEMVYIAFDEEAATVSGLPVQGLNLLLAVLTAVTVAVAMRVVGLLLVAALMVIPVAASMQVARSFRALMINAVLLSIAAVLIGLVVSFYLDLAPGGAVILTAVLSFVVTLAARTLTPSVKKWYRPGAGVKGR